MEYSYKDGLETPRLISRFLTPADAAVWEEFMSDKDTTEFFPLSLFPNQEPPSVQWIERQLNRYRTNGFGLQALISKDTGELVGQCGLLKQEVDGQEETEVGYHILKKHWGKGYAPEAARRFIDYAFEECRARSVISIIDIVNVKSQRVAEKNTLRREKETVWNGLDVYIYRIRKP